jgi:hypothetical protein
MNVTSSEVRKIAKNGSKNMCSPYYSRPHHSVVRLFPFRVVSKFQLSNFSEKGHGVKMNLEFNRFMFMLIFCFNILYSDSFQHRDENRSSANRFGFLSFKCNCNDIYFSNFGSKRSASEPSWWRQSGMDADGNIDEVEQ